MLIALYTVVDGYGVRSADSALQYVTTFFLLNCWPYGLVLWWRGPAFVWSYARRPWSVAVGGALAAIGAYGIALWVMSQALLTAEKHRSCLRLYLAAGSCASFHNPAHGRFVIHRNESDRIAIGVVELEVCYAPGSRLLNRGRRSCSAPLFELEDCLKMTETDVVRILAALGQPARLRAFNALVVAGRNGLTLAAIAQRLKIPASSLSFHLKELASAGLVTKERASRNVIYRATFDGVNGLIEYWTETSVNLLVSR